MANLNRLMGLSGCVAAGEFTPTGELVSYKGDLPEEIAHFLARQCAANSLMGRVQSEGLARLSGLNWQPFHGWAIAAGDYSLCVMGQIGVFVETDKADFNDIYRTLSEEANVLLKAA